ncbi:MAG: thermonuclease family protein [Gammaproteobacteria bacterium]|nr:thermonuclease family protein [Gammaproteobacteria bacterium]
MRNIKKALFIGAFFYAGTISASNTISCPATHINERAHVSKVHDGDTLRLDDGRKVRLIGIDTPELARRNQAEQPLAAEARTVLKQLVQDAGGNIKLQFGAERADRYQRTLAHIYLPDGRNVQAILIARGLATAYTTPPNSRLGACYRALEDQAIASRTGIWALKDYQLKSVPELTRDDDGFRRIQGTVTRQYTGKKGEWLIIDDKLRIHIAQKDIIHFKDIRLPELIGRPVQLHGWLHPRKTDFFMALRHPSALIMK